MASTRVVSVVLLVCGVMSGKVRDQGVEGPGEHYVRATTSTNFIPYNAPGLFDQKSRENTSLIVSRDKKKKQHPALQRRIAYNQEDIYHLLIPVKFNVTPDLVYQEQRRRSTSSEGPRQALNSPFRLIMDKDFNIRFDSPYIIPVSKPLAFVLDSSIAGRSTSYRSMAGGPYGNKMMIPFPVLVQARNPLPEETENGQYLGHGEYLEHRSNDDYDFIPGESFGRHPPRKIGHNTNYWKSNKSSYSETASPKSVSTSDDTTEEEGFNESSDGPSVYPKKIFEDMYYRSIPKYPGESQESRERERPYDDTRSKYSRSREGERPYDDTSRKISRSREVEIPYDDKRSKVSKSREGSTPPTKERQRTRPTSKYAFSRQPVFSATSDLEWVTHINSTASKKPTNSDEKVDSRTIIHDNVDVTTTTTDPLQPPGDDIFHQPTTISPAKVEIDKHFWREV